MSNMSYDLLTFTSVEDFLEYLDTQISQLKAKVDILEKRYAVLKGRAERVRMLEEMLSKLVGEQIKAINEVDFMGIKVVISARAVDELVVVEETLAALRDTLTALIRVRDAISRLAREAKTAGGGLSLLVQTLNGIPFKLLFKESETV
ncbi:MAG: hypothetical protein QXF69_02960 [Thermofilaceae archaeon]